MLTSRILSGKHTKRLKKGILKRNETPIVQSIRPLYRIQYCTVEKTVKTLKNSCSLFSRIPQKACSKLCA